MHPEDRARVWDLFEKCMREKSLFDSNYRLFVDGDLKYMYSVGFPMLNETGDLVEFDGAVIDITEHTEARLALENALREVKGPALQGNPDASG